MVSVQQGYHHYNSSLLITVPTQKSNDSLEVFAFRVCNFRECCHLSLLVVGGGLRDCHLQYWASLVDSYKIGHHWITMNYTKSVDGRESKKGCARRGISRYLLLLLPVLGTWDMTSPDNKLQSHQDQSSNCGFKGCKLSILRRGTFKQPLIHRSLQEYLELGWEGDIPTDMRRRRQRKAQQATKGEKVGEEEAQNARKKGQWLAKQKEIRSHNGLWQQ